MIHRAGERKRENKYKVEGTQTRKKKKKKKQGGGRDGHFQALLKSQNQYENQVIAFEQSQCSFVIFRCVEKGNWPLHAKQWILLTVQETTETQVQSLDWEDTLEWEIGNLLHYSCLENSMDRGAWWALVLGIPKSCSQLSIHTQKWSEHLKRQSLCRRGTRDTLSTHLPHSDKYRSGRVGRAMGSDWPVFEPQLCHLLALRSRASRLTFLNSNSNVFINNTKAIESRYYTRLF